MMQIIEAVDPRARAWLRHACDVLAGSDPGLTRLSQAIGGALSMATAIGVEYVFATLRGAGSQSTLIAMLLGAMTAMMGAMALTGTGARRKIGTAALFPVAMGLGMLPGVVVGGHVTAMLAVFVAVMFVAVFVRRFGPAFFFYGFMLWTGYFFSAFLHATIGMLPMLLADIAVGSAWVLLLSLSVLRTNPRQRLVRVRRSFEARSRRLIHVCAELLEAEGLRDVARQRRRLRSQQSQLAEAALMIEAWSAADDALPPGWTAPALRRRVLDLQLVLDRVAAAAEELLPAEMPLRVDAVRTLRALALADHAAGEREADALRRWADSPAQPQSGRVAARHLSGAVGEYLDLIRQDGAPPEVEPVGEFTPALTLAFGNLPGSAAVARNVPGRGRRWNPLVRLDFTSRQAVQVVVAGALAIVFGRELNSTRYYWAVIAAFIAFTGTGTRSETFLKASNRVLGTLVGLLAGIGLAHLTVGHTGWTLAVIVGSMFCGLYLVRISYAYMIFFVTIMVAQLYTMLHEFSDELLVLRLEETAIGAAVGIAVGFFVAPVSTRDTVASARRALLDALADLLEAIADRASSAPAAPDEPLPDLDTLSRELDSKLRALNQVARPLTRPLLVDNSPHLARHRLELFAAGVRAGKALGATRRFAVDHDAGLAGASRSLAESARAMGEAPAPLGAHPTARDPLIEQTLIAADPALFSTESANGSAGAFRNLTRLHAVLTELAGGAGEATPKCLPATVGPVAAAG
jgi:uncharacterized membrane protein YccC